jgi:oxygen-independent coproporphyrinogen-3 oxidase
MQFERVDIDLLRKYNEPGPRYTSYPTAPLFAESFGPDDFVREIDESNVSQRERPLSLYFHVPFCDELCYFCGCTMIVTRDMDKKEKYLSYLDREIDRVAERLDGGREVVQLHWGGGTPTDLSPEQIARLGARIHERFRFAAGGSDACEVSCEIDPRGLTREHLAALRGAGFNRVSMGVQDFDPKVQEAVNRIQPEGVTRDAVNWSRELGFESVNLDFIYGLPHQTLEGFAGTIDKIVDVSPDRIAIFNFAFVPWLKRHQKQLINPDTLPAPEARLEILKMTIEKLSAAGYVYIGMDHFAKPDDELTVAQKEGTLHRNFQGYSTKAGCDLYAFGMSGISQLDGVYAQNHKKLSAYYGALDEGKLPTRAGYRLDADDKLRREVITRLMCDMALDKGAIERRFGIVFDEYFADSIAKLGRFTDDGLLVARPGGYDVTAMGRLVIRNVAMCFDRYLDDMRGDKPLFSRTV